jgi:hypothetical protein
LIAPTGRSDGTFSPRLRLILQRHTAIVNAKRILTRRVVILTCVIAIAAVSISASPTAKSLKNKKGFTWISKSSANFNYYFEPGSPAERDYEKISGRMEKSHASLEKLLGGSTGEKTESFIVDSRARMKQLIGEEGNGYAFGSVNPETSKTEFVTAMVYSDTIQAVGAHEPCHALAHLLWGKPHGRWLDEGLAVYSDDQWNGLSLHPVAKVLLDKGHLLPIADLLDENWIKKYPDMVTYPELGSFVKFLYEKYGLESVKNIWQNGAKNADSAFGKNISALEAEWRAELAKVDASSIQYKY